MNLIEQDKIYKTDIFIDINGNVHYNKIFTFKDNKIHFIKKPTNQVYELKDSIVFPAFVNAHTHLELTNLDKTKLNFSSFVEWIISLIVEKRKKSDNFFLDSYFFGKNLLKKYNCSIFGNILSSILFNKIPKEDIPLNFVEIIEYNKDNINNVSLNFPKISPHSFFTVHPDLINKIIRTGKPISVHFFESKEEYDYLIHGRGDIPEKLFKFVGLKPLKYNLEYFIKFLQKAKNVQLVHLSNIPEELKPVILKKKDKIFFTLCPRSNKKLGFHSPYLFFIKNNIPFSLGTDSLCSNDDLNVLNEAKFIFEDLKDDFDNEKLAKILFLSLTKWGYKSIFLNLRMYNYLENTSIKYFLFSEFLEILFNFYL